MESTRNSVVIETSYFARLDVGTGKEMSHRHTSDDDEEYDSRLQAHLRPLDFFLLLQARLKRLEPPKARSLVSVPCHVSHRTEREQPP
jgi:hypothetical protein